MDAAPDTARIVLGGRGAEEHVVPTRVRVSGEGIVQFETVDGRVHTIEFFADSLQPDAREFLLNTGQLRSPPLLERGTIYEVSFAEAPPGYYPFFAQGPGSAVSGAVFVE